MRKKKRLTAPFALFQTFSLFSLAAFRARNNTCSMGQSHRRPASPFPIIFQFPPLLCFCFGAGRNSPSDCGGLLHLRAGGRVGSSDPLEPSVPLVLRGGEQQVPLGVGRRRRWCRRGGGPRPGCRWQHPCCGLNYTGSSQLRRSITGVLSNFHTMELAPAAHLDLLTRNDRRRRSFPFLWKASPSSSSTSLPILSPFFCSFFSSLHFVLCVCLVFLSSLSSLSLASDPRSGRRRKEVWKSDFFSSFLRLYCRRRLFLGLGAESD